MRICIELGQRCEAVYAKQCPNPASISEANLVPELTVFCGNVHSEMFTPLLARVVRDATDCFKRVSVKVLWNPPWLPARIPDMIFFFYHFSFLFIHQSVGVGVKFDTLCFVLLVSASSTHLKKLLTRPLWEWDSRKNDLKLPFLINTRSVVLTLYKLSIGIMRSWSKPYNELAKSKLNEKCKLQWRRVRGSASHTLGARSLRNPTPRANTRKYKINCSSGSLKFALLSRSPVQAFKPEKL